MLPCLFAPSRFAPVFHFPLPRRSGNFGHADGSPNPWRGLDGRSRPVRGRAPGIWHAQGQPWKYLSAVRSRFSGHFDFSLGQERQTPFSAAKPVMTTAPVEMAAKLGHVLKPEEDPLKAREPTKSRRGAKNSSAKDAKDTQRTRSRTRSLSVLCDKISCRRAKSKSRYAAFGFNSAAMARPAATNAASSMPILANV